MPKYHCKCGGLILPSFDSFKVGDDVNCMLETRKPMAGGRLNVNQRAITGKIVKIIGDDFEIKLKNKTYKFKLGEFTPIDAPGPIEYFRIGKCRCQIDQDQAHEAK